ncbi:MAG TPA: HAD-IIA family hydrolase [Gordonia sp. (in: high G+C Gram-positive bacteria)]|uniref:HAD-IIA family hydrolase n=1 Tax=Gordonia sp. (in: high G+C Gram-positive bacteria) TaxID=84139 RepID=UPI002BA3A96A|nr:HAD-IIA family hydrolase [Gordonia sp. (in: high G+C Gram-positive bacteria)]HRC52756.1 HAD-IIA family hydrolase [Gordonia sp. (in: high G+C Gram-positive bacteria)]
MLPDDVAAGDLDPSVRRDLRTLDKANAEAVARHLVMVGRLADEDPALALRHARAARERASRIGVVRETVGVAAYHAGEWQEALGELRAARRILGGATLLPLIADCERGLGRPDRALAIARGDDARDLSGEERLEMLIVEAGARLDLGEADKAVVTLQRADLAPGQVGPEATRLYYAYAEALLAAGRDDDAVTWFMNAAAADVDDLTDAELRVVELTDPDFTPAPSEPVPAPSEPGILVDDYDAVLLDLDGTVFAGHAPLPGAIEAVAALPADRIRYVTNNASRRPAEVAVHLREIGFDATPQQVVTSAQAGARLVAEQVPAGSTVLVVGTDGLAAEVAEVGLVPTRTADDKPRAVVQGHSPHTDWASLSEAALAIAAGALWVATNVDPTLPNERGFLIGNGSMVAAVASATKATPQVAGKPARPLLRDAIADVASDKPLVVGDRLDTDIEGANAVGADSLLVLTGVSTLRDVLVAAPEQRPTHIAVGLGALGAPVSISVIAGRHPWTVTGDGTALQIVGPADDAADDVAPESALPALVAAAWERGISADQAAQLAVTSDNSAVAGLLRSLGIG